MSQLPDAPWIRDAERNGYPPDDGEELCCPECGNPCRKIYENRNGEAVGCNICVEAWDVEAWFDFHKASSDDGRPDRKEDLD